MKSNPCELKAQALSFREFIFFLLLLDLYDVMQSG